MPGPAGVAAEAASVAALVGALSIAIWRPRGVSESVVAVPAAALLVVLGIVPAHAAGDRLKVIGPTVVFLAGILIFGQLCADAGVFDYLGAVTARLSHGQPRRLLVLVVAVAALVTAVLTLDATVVLLTPVVLATVHRLRLASGAASYACVRLANSASLLLPVSNLTNLLAFGSSGLSFGRFTALMTLPWVVVCVAEWATLRGAFRHELATPPAAEQSDRAVHAPRYALAVLAVTVTGFVVTSSAHVNPAWAAFGGCALLLMHRRASPRAVILAASPGFCFFVLALAVIVDGLTRHGLGSLLTHTVPHHSGLLELVTVAFAAAALANVVNNLPATLALVPLIGAQPALMLAMLLGVNIGPNATYPGSLATLLWRRMLPARDKPDAVQFHRLGLLTTPVILGLATVALWAATRMVGV